MNLQSLRESRGKPPAVDAVAEPVPSTGTVYTAPEWADLQTVVTNAVAAAPDNDLSAVLAHVRRSAPLELEAVTRSAGVNPRIIIAVMRSTALSAFQPASTGEPLCTAPAGRLVGFDRGRSAG